MFRRKLCPRCKTGLITYQLDSRSPICPYLSCHDGKKCSMYVELEKSKKMSASKKILRLFYALQKRCRKSAPFHQDN